MGCKMNEYSHDDYNDDIEVRKKVYEKAGWDARIFKKERSSGFEIYEIFVEKLCGKNKRNSYR
jgi:hypothetical protein